MEYNIVCNGEVKFITFENLTNIPFIKHGFSTRIGGVSHGTYDSLNLGLKTGDNKDDITENIKRFCEAVGVDRKKLVISDQVHGENIKVVTSQDAGKGYFLTKDFNEVDGLVTDVKGIPLLTIFADCVPIFFVDKKQEVVGVSHAGWKGTQLKIGRKTVETMIREYHSDPENIKVVIGPSIGECCYEVDKRIVDEFRSAYSDVSYFVKEKEHGKYILNLWQANKLSLMEAGILEKNILISNLCTGCNTDLFYSHRKENGNTGRMGAVIQLI